MEVVNMEKEIIQKAIKQYGCDDAELFVVKIEKYPVSFEASKLKSVKSRLLRGYSLRTIKNGRLGFSSCTSLKDKGNKLIESAISAGEFGPVADFSFWKGQRFPQPDVFFPETVSFEIEEAELMGRRIVRRLNEMLPEAYIDVSVSKAFQEVSHYTSETEKTYYKSLFSLGATSLTVRSGELLYINEGKDSCTIPEDPMAIIGNIIWKEKMSQNSVECPSKPMQVIFTPKTMPILMKGFTTGLAGRNVASKSSPLSDRIGEKILDSRVSIYDDGIMSAGPASAPFDDEGVPKQRFPLFAKGVLKNYFLDLASAAALKTEPTGSAERRFLAAPIAEPSNLVMEPGDTEYEDMIENMEDGLVIDQVIGGGQSNLLNGEFSMNVELGFRVKKGKIVGRVRNTMVAGNVYELFSDKIEAIGNKCESDGSVFTPYVLFKNVSISGRE